MSSENNNSRGRRSSNRGGRRSGNRSNRGPRSARQNSQPAKPKKKSLWEKISAFFGGGEPEKQVPSGSHGRVRPNGSGRSQESGRSQDKPRSEERSSERPSRSSGMRKPEIIEVTSPRIYVGNLSFDATETDLSELFTGVGTVDSVEVVANKHTQKSKGFAFVQMQSVDEAKRAVTELHDKEYMGRKLVVSGAKAPVERRSDRAETAVS